MLLWQPYDNNKMAENVLLWQRYDNNKMADMLLWQRYDNNKMADMCYCGNVMTTTRWRKQVQSMTVYDCTVEDVEYSYNKFSL